MNRSLLEILIDPVAKAPLWIEEQQLGVDGCILEGLLCSAAGALYPIVKGIPRFVVTKDKDQKQTERSFGYKWERRDSYDTEEFQSIYHDWLRQKYGFTTDLEMSDF